MEVKIIKSLEMDQNCYLLINGKDAVLIDPGEDTFKILKETEGYNVKYILLTHCHFDHVYSLSELKGQKIVLGAFNLIKNIVNPKITFLSPSENLKGKIDGFFSDGEVKNLCGIDIKCIYTPGHTDCSVCFLAENSLFSGDTLFFESVGRWDFETGNFQELENSVRNKLYSLPDDTKVYPGHGRQTSIGYEKKNGFFKEEI
ncbi:MAG TPA: MBL fold metallo-hydrolase [Clostridiales bacterium]|nr:MBL fold metallo-hydrolase [Clostridiales bacterium]